MVVNSQEGKFAELQIGGAYLVLSILKWRAESSATPFCSPLFGEHKAAGLPCALHFIIDVITRKYEMASIASAQPRRKILKLVRCRTL